MTALLMVHGYDPVTGVPNVPGGWEITPCADVPFFDVVHPSGRRVIVWRENENGVDTALLAVFGETADLADLAAIATNDMPARKAWRLRNNAQVKPRLRYWRTIRCTGARRIEGSWVPFADEVVQVVPRGVQMPDWATEGFPWYVDGAGDIVAEANATLRIDSVSGADTLAMSITLAGHGFPTDFADEPDPEA